MLVKDVMSINPYHVSACDSVIKAVTLMTSAKIQHLLVIDRGILIGIISINDIPEYIKPQLSVLDIMTLNPYCIQANDTIDHAKELLFSLRISSLPVLEGKQVVGIVTLSDLI